MNTKPLMHNLDMFDLNGPNKLDVETVEQREAIVAHYSKDRNALFFVSTSGGKDSDIMAITVRKLVPAKQIIYVHANLGEAVEHPGIVEHIKKYIPPESELHIVKNERKDFIDMVLLRGMFPASHTRQCTSDLKTTQIDKLIRRVMKERGATVGFNVIGLRSQESVPRSKKSPLILEDRLTLKSGKRTVFTYMPVFHLTEQEVFDGICAAGQEPFHVYGVRNQNNVAVRVSEGNKRVSCKYCIMGCKNDLKNGALWYPDEYALMIALERVVNHTMFFKTVKKQTVKVSLAEKAEVAVDEVAVRRYMMILHARREKLLEAKHQEQAQKDARKAAKSKAKYVDNHTIAMF